MRINRARDGTASAPRVVLVAVLVVTCTVLPVFMVGALGVPIRRELGFGESRLGLSVALFFLASALLSGLVGPLVERLGASRSSRLACASSGVGLCGMALAASGWGTLTLWLCVAALGLAVGTPAANLALARRVSLRRLGTAFGVKQASAPAATLLAGLAVPGLAVTLGWRVALLAGAGVTLLIMLGIPELEEQPGSASPGNTPEPLVTVRSTRTILVVLGAAFAMGNMAVMSVGVFTVEFAVASGVGIGVAGLVLAMGSVCGIATRVLAGLLADRRSGGHLRVVGLMIALGGAGHALLSTGVTWLVVVGAVLGFTAGYGWNGLFSLAVVQENPAAPALATGVTHAGGYLGAAVGPLLFGVIVEHRGYSAAWGFIAVAGLVGAALMLGGHVLTRRQQQAGSG